jgi:hypothetical protein
MAALEERPIKAIANHRGMTGEALLSASTDIASKVYQNVNFSPPLAPAPPVDEATLTAANAALAAANAAALDGGKQARAELRRQKDNVAKLLKQLVAYVEANCKNDITIFLSSGLTPAISKKTVTPPVSESIRRAQPGDNSGEIVITLMKYPGARSYELRRAQVGPGGVLGEWIIQPAAATRPPITISGLTPGATYEFQMRGLTQAGYTDWSDSVTRIVI